MPAAVRDAVPAARSQVNPSPLYGRATCNWPGCIVNLGTVKHRHHFVPRFYLTRFASAPRRIQLYNFARNQWIANASLRDQCYRHKLYGTDAVEDQLAAFEAAVAPTVASVTQTMEPPEPRSTDHLNLIAFAALQMMRTPAHAARHHEATTRMLRVAYDGQPPASMAGSAAQMLAIALEQTPSMIAVMADLRMHIARSAGRSIFLTSDNPVFRYNLYCEAISWQGTTGAACRGFQLFLPLSPQALLVLADPAVYRLGISRGSTSTTVSEADVEALNLMQFVSAEQNVYASHLPRRAADLAARGRKLAAKRVQRVQQADEVGGDSQILHSYEQLPNVRLALSFVRVRRDARRVPINDRLREARRPIAEFSQAPVPPHLAGRTVTFAIRPPGQRGPAV